MLTYHTFSKTKNLVRRIELFYIWQIFLMSGLIEDSRVLIFASAFKLLRHILDKVYEENLASHRYVIGKWEYFKSVSDHCGYSSLILQQNLQSDYFRLVAIWNLKVY